MIQQCYSVMIIDHDSCSEPMQVAHTVGTLDLVKGNHDTRVQCHDWSFDSSSEA